MNKKIIIELTDKETEILVYLLKTSASKLLQLEESLDEEVSAEEILAIKAKLE